MSSHDFARMGRSSIPALCSLNHDYINIILSAVGYAAQRKAALEIMIASCHGRLGAWGGSVGSNTLQDIP